MIGLKNSVRSKVFMMDMDGVVLRHPTVFKILGSRVQSFVRKNVNPYMSDKEVEKMNQVLYKDFGHTVLGLQRLYDSNISINNFCEYVYDKPLMNYVEILNRDDIFNENALEFRRFLETCKDKDIPVFIFSNANQLWCRSILDTMEITSLPNSHIIGCDSQAYQTTKEVCLKPNKVTYSKAVQYVYKTLAGPLEREFVYVDDQVQNLMPVLNNQYWKKVWFNTDKEKTEIYTPSMCTVRSIPQLYNLL